MDLHQQWVKNRQSISQVALKLIYFWMFANICWIKVFNTCFTWSWNFIHCVPVSNLKSIEHQQNIELDMRWTLLYRNTTPTWQIPGTTGQHFAGMGLKPVLYLYDLVPIDGVYSEFSWGLAKDLYLTACSSPRCLHWSQHFPSWFDIIRVRHCLMIPKIW